MLTENVSIPVVTDMFISPLDLSTLDGTSGFIINGISQSAGTGRSVAFAGDINDDGLSDLVIGAQSANNNIGQSYVVFGSRRSWPTIVSLSSLNGSNGFILNGFKTNGRSGISVASAGDINDDGVSDLIIGAYLADSAGGSQSGQSYVVFGDSSSVRLIANQLQLAQGDSVLLNATYLSSNCFENICPSVSFTISGLQHGYFELLTNSAVSITQFTQSQLNNRQVRFIHDGSQKKPIYSVGFIAGLTKYSPQPANIIFKMKPEIVNASLSINQNQQKILSSHDLFTSDDIPFNQLIYSVSNVRFGYFSRSNNKNLVIIHFSQTDVNQGMVIFTQQGAAQKPTFDVTVNDGLFNTGPIVASITFNPAPVIVNNQLTLNQGATVTLSSRNLQAIDDVAGDIQFTVSDVTHGYFQKITNPGIAISTFDQVFIDNSFIQFVSNSNVTAPAYSVAVADSQGASSLPVAGIVNFVISSQTNQVIHNNGSTDTTMIAAAVVGGGILLGGGFLFLINKHNKNLLHQYIEQASKDNKNLKDIAEVVFEIINVTGCLSYISQKYANEYIDAIKEVMTELAADNFPPDLATMGTDEKKKHFLEEFPKQIKETFFGSKQSRMRLFKPKITPSQIKEQARHIAPKIKHIMNEEEHAPLQTGNDSSRVYFFRNGNNVCDGMGSNNSSEVYYETTLDNCSSA